MAIGLPQARAVPRPAIAISRAARDAADALIWSAQRWPLPLLSLVISSIFAPNRDRKWIEINRRNTFHGTFHHTHRSGATTGSDEREYRRNYTCSLPQIDQTYCLC